MMSWGSRLLVANLMTCTNVGEEFFSRRITIGTSAHLILRPPTHDDDLKNSYGFVDFLLYAILGKPDLRKKKV
jgi:hypothetical protein